MFTSQDSDVQICTDFLVGIYLRLISTAFTFVLIDSIYPPGQNNLGITLLYESKGEW